MWWISILISHFLSMLPAWNSCLSIPVLLLAVVWNTEGEIYARVWKSGFLVTVCTLTCSTQRPRVGIKHKLFPLKASQEKWSLKNTNYFLYWALRKHAASNLEVYCHLGLYWETCGWQLRSREISCGLKEIN